MPDRITPARQTQETSFPHVFGGNPVPEEAKTNSQMLDTGIPEFRN
jgi:hypothetical protein